MAQKLLKENIIKRSEVELRESIQTLNAETARLRTYTLPFTNTLGIPFSSSV